jgi:FkbM family methyltransferase
MTPVQRLQESVAFLASRFDAPEAQAIPRPVRVPITRRLEGLFEELIALTRPGIIVEIGAHEAAFSHRMRRQHPTAECFAFECNPSVFDRFEPDATTAGIRYRHLAIGAGNGTTRLHIPRRWNGEYDPAGCLMASLNVIANGDRIGEAVEVPSMRLDDAIAAAGASARCALWIDAEGALDQVLSGAVGTLARTDLLLCELERSPYWQGQRLAPEMIAALAGHGFCLAARDAQKWFQYNGVFVRAALLEQRPEALSLALAYAQDAAALWEGETPQGPPTAPPQSNAD